MHVGTKIPAHRRISPITLHHARLEILNALDQIGKLSSSSLSLTKNPLDSYSPDRRSVLPGSHLRVRLTRYLLVTVSDYADELTETDEGRHEVYLPLDT